MKIRYYLTLFVISLLITLVSCYNDNEEVLYPAGSGCDTKNVTYTTDVIPVIQSNCISCHSASNPSGSIRLDDYQNLVLSINSGRFQGAINHQSGFSAMPQGGGKISSCSLAKINQWITDGFPNN
ncbi:MAG: hypothetical protein Q7J34_06145 [Bacteroidales bacterium]|nr:hypothetical protein [Bacteroidales bacterium]